MRTEIVIPKTGLVVLDPQTMTPLPAKGREVSIDSYWLRRIDDGDVRIATPQPAKSGSKPAAQE